MESKVQRLNLTILSAFLLVGFLGVATPGAFGASEQPKRLHKEIEDRQTFALKGHLHPAIEQKTAQDLGEVASSKIMPTMRIHFAMTAAQKADFEQLAAAQQNRRSPQFHKFLTPEEYAARFGLNTADIEKFSQWLARNGFTNIQPSRSRMWIEFQGTAGQVANTFHSPIHKFSVNGEVHFANASEPELPRALEGIVLGIAGLHDFLPRPHLRRPRPHFTSSISGNTYLAPDDWETIYDVKSLYNAGLDGSPIAQPSGSANYCNSGASPCSIVVVGQSDVQDSDLANFRAAANLPAKGIDRQLASGTNPGLVSSGDEGESDLDLEWANGIAKNANVLFVIGDPNNGNGVLDSWYWAINNNAAPILTTSYGNCETATTQSGLTSGEQLFGQAVIQGMTVISAAGDSGAADCDPPSATSTETSATQGLAVDYPASSAYVTGVGGTEFTVENTTGTYWGTSNSSAGGSALQYIPEVVWNDGTTNNPFSISAGGGGVSAFVTKPSWQTGTGVPGGNFRTVPDIALAASPDVDGFLYCTTPYVDPATGNGVSGVNTCANGFRNGSSNSNYVNDLSVIGGTSVAAPSFAGVMALLVQQMDSRLGLVNPNIYTIADISQTAFHDITSGNNNVPCETGSPNCGATGELGYSASVGYDLASGWGSIDAANLFDQWSEDITISSNPTQISLQAGGASSATITAGFVSTNPSNPSATFTGTISFACSVSSGLTNVTCSVPSTTVSNSGTTTVTITAASSAGIPLWRRIQKLPPTGIGLLLLSLAMAMMLYFMRKQSFVRAWGAAAMLVFVLGTVSCGGGSSGGGTTTPPPASESGTVTVTASSGQLINSVAIAVTVQ